MMAASDRNPNDVSKGDLKGLGIPPFPPPPQSFPTGLLQAILQSADSSKDGSTTKQELDKWMANKPPMSLPMAQGTEIFTR